MTNRKKYIDNMTDKRLALFLSCGSQIIDNQIDTNPSLTDNEEIRKQAARNCEEIEKWLSQEVEEYKEQISCNVCKYAIRNGYTSAFMYHHTCKNVKSERFNKGVDVVNDGCDKGEIKGPSQEAEEDKTKTTFDYEKPEIIQLTKQAYKDVLARLDSLEERVKNNVNNIY